jgi:GTP-binding protein HflX
MNALTEADVDAADRLFSTLDPTIRRLKLPGRARVMLADTVGFIHRLPHTLIQAFKATLEEVRIAELLLHVVDASSTLADERITVVDRVLEEIGAGDTPRLIVLNKSDLLPHGPDGAYGCEAIEVSALRREGLEQLRRTIARRFDGLREEVAVKLPLMRSDLIAMARRDGEVLSEEYAEGVVSMRAVVSTAVAGRLRKAALSAA